MSTGKAFILDDLGDPEMRQQVNNIRRAVSGDAARRLDQPLTSGEATQLWHQVFRRSPSVKRTAMLEMLQQFDSQPNQEPRERGLKHYES